MAHDTKEEKKCFCKESSCGENCTRNHTHKGFSCEKCTQPEEKKCRCACHVNKLKKPYEHDTKCCDKMNGFIPTPPPETSTDWEHKFNETLEYSKRDYCVGCGLTKNGLQIIREEAQREVLKDLLKYYYQQKEYKDSPFPVVLEEFCEIQSITISDNEKK